MICPACGQSPITAAVESDEIALSWEANAKVYCPVTPYRCPCGQVFFVPVTAACVEPFKNVVFV